MCGLHNHASLVSLKAVAMTTCKVANNVNDFTHILRYLCNRQKLLDNGRIWPSKQSTESIQYFTPGSYHTLPYITVNIGSLLVCRSSYSVLLRSTEGLI